MGAIDQLHPSIRGARGLRGIQLQLDEARGRCRYRDYCGAFSHPPLQFVEIDSQRSGDKTHPMRAAQLRGRLPKRRRKTTSTRLALPPQIQLSLEKLKIGRRKSKRSHLLPLSLSDPPECVPHACQRDTLKLLGTSGGMTPSELWAALKISKQGAMDLLRPLVKAGLVKRVGTLKTGRYVLK